MSDYQGRLKGKAALITGAGNGMGYATAKLFLEEGAKVIAVDISEKALAQWSDMENVIPVLALFPYTTLFRSAETRFGRLDAVCNIAGINDLCYPLEETDDERWDKVHNIDLKAPFRICRRAIPIMLKSGGGAIVNIGSYAAVRGNHGPSYTAAKAGINGLTKSIAVEYGKQGIRCNVVNPGGVNTNLVQHTAERSGGNWHPTGEALSKLVQAMPVNWYGEAEDIAKICLFLCSDDSKYINGAVIAADGGMACC